MLVDLLDLNNYLLINTTLIKIFGLKAAAYCSELFTIVKKAVSKNKVVENQYIAVDRNYVESKIGVSIEEQIQFEDAWAAVDLLARHPSKKDTFTLNVSGFVQLITNAKDLTKTEIDKLKKKLKVKQTRVSKEEKNKAVAQALKNGIIHTNLSIKAKLEEWVDEMCQNYQYPLSKSVVKSFVDTLDKYTQNEDVATTIIQIAINNGYRDCTWAINSYERTIGNRPRATTQTKASSADVDKGEAF